MSGRSDYYRRVAAGQHASKGAHSYPPGAVLVTDRRSVRVVDREGWAVLVRHADGALRDWGKRNNYTDYLPGEIRELLDRGATVDVHDTAKGLALLDYVMSR